MWLFPLLAHKHEGEITWTGNIGRNNMSSFPPIYKTYYNYTNPIYKVEPNFKEVERIQERKVVYEVTLYDRWGNLITTKVT